MKKKIAIIITILLIIAVGGGVAFFVKSNKKEEKSESVGNIKWGDSYLEILKNDSKFEELDNPKIQLIDLNLDKIPELILYGKNFENSKYVAKVFEAKKDGTKEHKIELDNEFKFNYVKDVNTKDDFWIVTSVEKNYSIDLKKENIIEESDIKLNSNYVSIENNDIYEVSDNLDEDFKKIEEEYESNKNELVSIVDKNIGQVEFLKTLSLRDSTKNFVASSDKYPFTNPTMLYPYLNISNEKAYDVNRAISADFGFKSYELDDSVLLETKLQSYDWFINDKTLSIVCIKGGNDSTWGKTYNVDLETCELIDNSDLLKEIDLTEAKNKITEYVNKKLDEDLEKIEKTYAADWHATSVAEWKEDLKENLDNIENVYLNENGDACIRVEYETFGGQEYCTKTLEMNVSKNTEPVEITYEEYLNGTREMVRTNVLYKAYYDITSDSYDGEVTDLSQYFGKDLVETAKELKFEASESTNTATGEKFVNSYVVPTNTNTRISDAYDPTGRTTNFYTQGKVNQIGIEGSITKERPYTVYGLKAGMTLEECIELLEPLGIAKRSRAGMYDYSIHFNDGSQVALNFRAGQHNELLSSYTVTVAPN